MRPVRELGRAELVVLLVFGLSITVLTKSAPFSWSDASRMGTIQAIVEHGTLALDDTLYLHQGDKVRLGGPVSEGGRYYSHQPPMLALLGSVPYAVLHAFGRGIADPGTYRIITLSVVVLPLLVGLLCLARLMRRAGASSGDTGWLLAGAAFGTLAFPYALVLNQHGTAAGLVMIALYLVDSRRWLWAGVAMSLATTVDLTAVFFALAMVLPIARQGRLRAVLRYGAGALPALMLHFGINYAIVGDLKPLGLHEEAFHYPMSPFLLMTLTGHIDESVSISFGEYAFGALFGGSGLFSHHPVLLFAVVAGALAMREGQRAPDDGATSDARLAPSLDHALLMGAAAIVVYYLLQSRNFGGSAFGMRWFCVFAPSLMLLPAIWLGRTRRRLELRPFVPLLLWSVATSAFGALQPWAKFEYWPQSPALAAEILDRRDGDRLIEHWGDQWTQMTKARDAFDEDRARDHHLRLMRGHALRLLRRLPDQTEQQHRAELEQGLVRLQRSVLYLDWQGTETLQRAWGHFWLSHLHRALGQRVAADRELAISLELAPNLHRSQFFKYIEEERRKPASAQGPRR